MLKSILGAHFATISATGICIDTADAHDGSNQRYYSPIETVGEQDG